MNKKGFTLVEIIVSVGLLALIGVAVGISLNKTFKNQEKMNYQEYVDKVKSAALLYANNTTQITNELNSNASFKILKVEELINNGYINKSLENPKTKEKIKDDEEVRIYYNENNELVVEYPYNKSEDDVYLYTINYSITYKSNESNNLCYKDINKSTLQLINSERGVLQLNIDVFGKSVHSSKEPEGINALTRAMDIYYNIKIKYHKKRGAL